MKLKAGIFLAIFALTAGFCLAAGAALNSEADEPHFTGELLSGSRGAAGFTLTLDAAFEERLVLSETYDASSGEGSSRGARRSSEPLRLHEDSAEPALEYPSLFLTLNYYWDFGEPLPGELPAALVDEVEALIAEGGGERRLSLSDFTDRAPLCFQTRNIARKPDSAAAYGLASGGERFALPAPEDAELELSLHVNTKSYSLFVSVEGPAVDAVSNSVYTGGGLYLLLADAAFFTGGGAEPVSPELLPGGAFGIYRVPCEAGEDGFAVDLGAAENIFPLARCSAAALLSGPEGGLLLASLEEGALYLTAIDPDTGREAQRLKLAEGLEAPGQGRRLFTAWDCGFSDGLFRAQLGERYFFARCEGGRFEPLPEVGAASLPDAAPAGPVSAALASAAYEDGLLYTLEHISWPQGSPEGGFAYAHRLAAFDGEGSCLYCEQLSHPLTDYFNRPPSSGTGEFRLTGPERS